MRGDETEKKSRRKIRQDMNTREETRRVETREEKRQRI